MGRPLKEGVDWMRYSVHMFSERKMCKLRRLSLRGEGVTFAECFAVMTSALCHIYANRGYYAEFGEDLIFDIVEDTCLKYEQVEMAIKRLVEAEIFESKIFLSDNILTSDLCKKEFANATKKRRSMGAENGEMGENAASAETANLFSKCYEDEKEGAEKVNDGKTIVFDGRNEVNSDNNPNLRGFFSEKTEFLTDNRVEKSRVEKSRVYISARVHAREETDREKEIFEIALLFFCKGFTSPLAEAQKFYDHFEALGWKNGSGQPIVKKMSKANAWVPASEKRVFSDGQASFMTTLRSTLKKDGLDHQLLWHVRGVRMKDGVVTMFTTAEVMNYFEQNSVTMKKVLQKFGASKLIYSLVEAALRKEA